jgi:hypothetical protein
MTASNIKIARLVKESSNFELDMNGVGNIRFIDDNATKGMHLTHDHLAYGRITVIIVATSSLLRSGSSSFFILAIS